MQFQQVPLQTVSQPGRFDLDVDGTAGFAARAIFDTTGTKAFAAIPL